MKITYDKDADALYIQLTDKKIVDSEEISENVVADFDAENNIVGIEMVYFIAKHKKDFFPVFKQMEQSVWGIENLATA
ncbi:MAG: DUF2283 domain-containing protein [Bacteroidetes bacterium]|nr:MAG: DUF2283 domain-containing protein [Bacteroidota bacterium]